MTERPCPLCASNEATLFLETRARSYSGESYRVVECVDCRLRYTRPLPSAEELRALYEDEYYAYSRDSGDGDASSGLRGRIAGLATVFKGILHGERRRALMGRPPGRVLDVGCGNGDFLLTLKKQGWEAVGMDFSTVGCELTRAKGMEVHQGSLIEAGFPDRSFDVVTLWHVVEHLPQPLEQLAEVRRVLRDDGLLILEVPNSASPTLRLCQESWSPLDVPRHLQHFTPSTLRVLLQHAGFGIVSCTRSHLADYHMDFCSFLSASGVLERTGITHFSTDFAAASLGSKALFTAAGLPLTVFSVIYSACATVITGNSNYMMVTARKAPLAGDAPHAGESLGVQSARVGVA